MAAGNERFRCVRSVKMTVIAPDNSVETQEVVVFHDRDGIEGKKDGYGVVLLQGQLAGYVIRIPRMAFEVAREKGTLTDTLVRE